MLREGSCYLCGGKPTFRITWRMTSDEAESAANYCEEHGPEEVEYLKAKGAVDINMEEVNGEPEEGGPTPLA